MSESNCRNQYQSVLVIVLTNFSLAILNVLLKKVVDAGINRLALITYRTLIAAVFLAPIAYFWERKTRPKLTSGILCYLFISAMLGATLTQYFLLLGIQNTSVTFTCAFINAVPAITFLMALPFGLETVDMKRKSGLAKVLGTTVCVAGAMVLTLYKGVPLTNHSESSEPPPVHANHVDWLSPNNKNERWTIGTIALVVGIMVWSSWFLVQTKISKRYPCPYSSTVLMCFFSALQSAALSLVLDRDISLWVIKGKLEILTVVYAGIVGSGLCFVGMAWCVKKRDAVFTAAFSPLIQIVVAMFDFSVLHEQLHLGSVLGSILVIVGLYILLWGKSKEAKTHDEVKQVQPADDHDEEDKLPLPLGP